MISAVCLHFQNEQQGGLWATPIFWGFPKKRDQHGSDPGTYLGWFHAFVLVGINPPMQLLTSIRQARLDQLY